MPVRFMREYQLRPETGLKSVFELAKKDESEGLVVN